MTPAAPRSPTPSSPGPVSEPTAADRRFTAVGTAVLLATAATVAAAAVAWGGGRAGWPQSVGWAAAICLPGALAAWIVARRQAGGPAGAVASSLGAILLRIIPPLVALGWISAGRRTADSSAAGGLLVVFYLSLLAIDILLHMMGASRRRGLPTPPD